MTQQTGFIIIITILLSLTILMMATYISMGSSAYRHEQFILKMRKKLYELNKNIKK